MDIENHVIREKEIEDAMDYAWECRQPVCSCCEETIFSPKYREVDGEIYCEDCFEEKFHFPIPDFFIMTCPICGRTNEDEFLEFYRFDEDEIRCEHCIDFTVVENERY